MIITIMNNRLLLITKYIKMASDNAFINIPGMVMTLAPPVKI